MTCTYLSLLYSCLILFALLQIASNEEIEGIKFCELSKMTPALITKSVNS